MKENSYFNFNEIGELVIERTFFESYYPILFTCRSDKQVLYLCVCCLAEEGLKKWLIADVNPGIIVKMLNNKITLRDTFLSNNGHRFTIIFKNSINSIIPDVTSDWHPTDSIYLPKPHEYMKADENEFVEEIKFYTELENNRWHYCAYTYGGW